jgi:exonuclease VII small subunit
MINCKNILFQVNNCDMIFFNLLLVFLLGTIFGFAELLQRYPEAKYNFRVFLSHLFIFINGLISIISFLFIKSFKGQELTGITSIEYGNIIISGLGGMMILRSSIFSISHHGKKVDIGFAPIFQVFLDVVEKKMKNGAAALRVEAIDKIMKNVDFNLAKVELPTLCTRFIDNFTPEDKKNLETEIKAIDEIDIDNSNKSLQLGRAISIYCDEEILNMAILKLPHILKSDQNSTTGTPNKSDDEFESRKTKLKN